MSNTSPEGPGGGAGAGAGGLGSWAHGEPCSFSNLPDARIAAFWRFGSLWCLGVASHQLTGRARLKGGRVQPPLLTPWLDMYPLLEEALSPLRSFGSFVLGITRSFEGWAFPRVPLWW